MYYPYTVKSGRTINGAFRKVSRGDFVSYNIAITVLHRWMKLRCGRLEYRVLNTSFSDGCAILRCQKTAQVT